VTDSLANNLTAVDASRGTVTGTFAAGETPYEVALDAQDGDLFIADYGSDNSSVVNASTGSAVASIDVGPGAFGVLYDATTGQVYFTIQQTDTVTVVNPARDAVVTTISIPGASNYSTSSPEGIALDPANGDLYVADASNDTLSVIDPARNTVVGAIPVGASPGGVLYDPVDGYLYVTDQYSASVSVVNPGNATAFATLAVGDAPFPLAFDSANDDVYVGNILSNNLSIIATSALPPALTGVSVTPPVPSVPVSGELGLQASPVCSGGPCPEGTTYSWRLSNSLGELNRSTGSMVLFTAGNVSGTDDVFVNASLNGTSVATGPIPINITTGPPLTTLSSVLISPGSAQVEPLSHQEFEATPVCSEGACPPGATFAWSLGNSLGDLNSTSGSLVEFSAGNATGNDSISVRATLDRISVESTLVRINIAAPIVPPPLLVSVGVSPSTSSLHPGETTVLVVAPDCGPITCPANVSFHWSLNRSDGSITPVSGSSSTYTAGDSLGPLTVVVNATLANRSALGFAAIDIEPLVAVPSPGQTSNQSAGGATFLGISAEGYAALFAAALALSVVLGLLLLRYRKGPPAGPPRAN
jgi:YVTN family beta-propeller protein